MNRARPELAITFSTQSSPILTLILLSVFIQPTLDSIGCCRSDSHSASYYELEDDIVYVLSFWICDALLSGFGNVYGEKIGLICLGLFARIKKASTSTPDEEGTNKQLNSISKAHPSQQQVNKHGRFCNPLC